MSDLKRVILLPLDEKEILALANCAAVGFSVLTTGEVGERIYNGAANSLRAMSGEEWNAMQRKVTALIRAALPEVKTTSINVHMDDVGNE